MSDTWILVADSGRARIVTPRVTEGDPQSLDEVIHFAGRAGYTGEEKFPAEKLDEIEDLVHPSGQMKPQDTVSDRPGRDTGPVRAESFESRHVDFNHEQADDFCREIVDHLTNSLREKRFEKLAVIAPPLFLGVLRKRLTKPLQDLVVYEADKDYTKLSLDDLRSRLPEEL